MQAHGTIRRTHRRKVGRTRRVSRRVMQQRFPCVGPDSERQRGHRRAAAPLEGESLMETTTSPSRRTFLAGAAAAGAALAAESLLPTASHAASSAAPVEMLEWHGWGGDSKTY